MSPPPTGPDPLLVVTEPRVIAAPGTLPPFPARSAVFVANLMGLFFGNEEKTRLLAETVGEVDSYGGRLLPIVDLLFAGKERNLLVLEREHDPTLGRYLGAGLGLSLPEVFVLPPAEYLEIGRELARGGASRHPAVARIAQHPAERMDGYVTDPTLEALARATGKSTLSTAAGSRRGNDKLLLHRHVEKMGLPVLPTEYAGSPAEVPGCLLRLRAEGFQSAVVKAPVGASGIGLIRVESIDDFPQGSGKVPEHYFLDGPCLVQGWLRTGERGIVGIRSPSVQIYLDDGTVTLYDITEQILSGSSVHEGNVSPPPYLTDRPELRYELLRQAGIVGRWLHEQGYRGTGSVDFLIAEYGSGKDAAVHVCEINARVTGATYPAVLAHHLLPGSAWTMRNLRLRCPLSGADVLDRLARAGELFQGGQNETGVLPINFNFGADGLVHKGQFLCLAPTLQGSEFLLRMAAADLPCVSDRD